MQAAGAVILVAAIAVLSQERQVAPFRSVEVDGGGHVVLRYAQTHRVRLVTGNMDVSRVEVTRGGELVIEKCRTKCPKGYRLEVDVYAPTLNSVRVENGGQIETRETFPRQADLTVTVNNGGMIDVRSISADRVTAAVSQGGGIKTAVRARLTASVANGGNITYWGDPEVRRSVDHGGAVQRAVN